MADIFDEQGGSRMTRYIARFSPQAWISDNAIEVDPQGPTEWDVTDEILLWSEDDQISLYNEIADNGEALGDDLLKRDPNAPEWIREWSGPFDIWVRFDKPTYEELADFTGDPLDRDKFKDRPDHPNFWKLAKIVMDNDASVTKDGKTIPEVELLDLVDHIEIEHERELAPTNNLYGAELVRLKEMHRTMHVRRNWDHRHHDWK